MKPIIVMGVNIDEIQRRIVEMVVITHRSCSIMKHKCVGVSKLHDHVKPPLACGPWPYKNMLGLLQVPFKFEASLEFATYITFVNMVFYKISCLTSACIYKQYQSYIKYIQLFTTQHQAPIVIIMMQFIILYCNNKACILVLKKTFISTIKLNLLLNFDSSSYVKR